MREAGTDGCAAGVSEQDEWPFVVRVLEDGRRREPLAQLLEGVLLLLAPVPHGVRAEQGSQWCGDGGVVVDVLPVVARHTQKAAKLADSYRRL